MPLKIVDTEDNFMTKLSHTSVWAAIDQLAERYDLTPSVLARRAGLDTTIFNKSKRMASNGRERWPSTESLAKIIEATGSTVDEFMSLMERPASTSAMGDFALSDALPVNQSVPLIGLAEAGTGGVQPPGDGEALERRRKPIQKEPRCP